MIDIPLILHIYRLSQSTLLCVKYGGNVYICITKPKKHYMKKIKITFGTGNDSVRHIIDVNHPDELRNFLSALQGAGWNLSEITSIVGGWTF